MTITILSQPVTVNTTIVLYYVILFCCFQIVISLTLESFSLFSLIRISVGRVEFASSNYNHSETNNKPEFMSTVIIVCKIYTLVFFFLKGKISHSLLYREIPVEILISHLLLYSLVPSQPQYTHSPKSYYSLNNHKSLFI